MKPTVKVVGLSGSMRSGSYTKAAVKAALAGAAASGAETQLLDLQEFPLPLADGVYADEQAPESATRLRRVLREADGIILGTPEYHGTISGAMKNALDWMGRTEFDGKVVGLVGVSGGAMGGFDAINTLRSVMRNLHGLTVPDQAAVPQAWKVFDESGGVKSDDIRKRLETVGHETARHASILRAHPRQ